MSYSIVDYSDTTAKLTIGMQEIIFKKAYASTMLDGDYVILSFHNYETGTGKQQYAINYEDVVVPVVASASELKTAIDSIINTYDLAGSQIKEYIVLIKQVDTSEPEVVTEIKNSFNDAVAFIYLSDGLYQITSDEIAESILNGKLEAWCQAFNQYTEGFVDVRVSLEEFILLLVSKDKSYSLTNGIISDPDGFYPTLLRLKIHP